MGVKVRAGTTAAVTVGRRDGTEADDWDESRARRVLGVVAAALGGCVADE